MTGTFICWKKINKIRSTNGDKHDQLCSKKYKRVEWLFWHKSRKFANCKMGQIIESSDGIIRDNDTG